MIFSFALGPLTHLGQAFTHTSAPYLISWLIGASLSYPAAGNPRARVILILFRFIAGFINSAVTMVSSV